MLHRDLKMENFFVYQNKQLRAQADIAEAQQLEARNGASSPGAGQNPSEKTRLSFRGTALKIGDFGSMISLSGTRPKNSDASSLKREEQRFTGQKGVGTICYCAPETQVSVRTCFRGVFGFDPRSRVWQLCIDSFTQ